MNIRVSYSAAYQSEHIICCGAVVPALFQKQHQIPSCLIGAVPAAFSVRKRRWSHNARNVVLNEKSAELMKLHREGYMRDYGVEEDRQSPREYLSPQHRYTQANTTRESAPHFHQAE